MFILCNFFKRLALQYRQGLLLHMHPSVFSFSILTLCGSPLTATKTICDPCMPLFHPIVLERDSQNTQDILDVFVLVVAEGEVQGVPVNGDVGEVPLVAGRGLVNHRSHTLQTKTNFTLNQFPFLTCSDLLN